MLLTGCDKDDKDDETPVTTDFFSFQTNVAEVKEGGSVEVAVYWSKTTPKEAELTLAVTNMGAKYKAVEDVDYEISTKTLKFGADEYVKTVTITAKQNNVWQNNRSFFIEFEESTDEYSYLGAESGKIAKSAKVTILDDDDSVLEGQWNSAKGFFIVLEPAETRGLFHFSMDDSAETKVIDMEVRNDRDLDPENGEERYTLYIDMPQNHAFAYNGEDYEVEFSLFTVDAENEAVAVEGEEAIWLTCGYGESSFVNATEFGIRYKLTVDGTQLYDTYLLPADLTFTKQ